MISDEDLKYVSEQVTYSIPIPFSNGYLTSFEIRELARELLERRKADRWIPVELGKIPKHQMLEACNIKAWAIDICMLGSISWEKINPTHYRPARPLPEPPEAQA